MEVRSSTYLLLVDANVLGTWDLEAMAMGVIITFSKTMCFTFASTAVVAATA